jgi:broad specificity phosphatase PhoE
MRPQPDADTTYLYLIRHGATTANERQPPILQGKGIDLPLSSTGERQVSALGRFLHDFPIKRIYTSTLLRAQQTARAIAQHHDEKLEIDILAGLVECDVGQWEGLDWTTIETNHPEPCRLFLENPAENPYLGGESYGDVYRRVRPILHDLLEKHRGESIAVVAHNVVNRVYLSGLIGLDISRAKDMRQQNACVNLITHSKHGTHVTTLNSVFHLDEPPI